MKFQIHHFLFYICKTIHIKLIQNRKLTKINQTKVAIERYQNEQLLLKNNNSWVDGIDNIGGYIKDLKNIDENHVLFYQY
jgi:hypothetical protein